MARSQLTILILFLTLQGGPVLGQTNSGQTRRNWGPFQTKGEIGLTALFVDVNGSEEKYRTDYNYLPGFNLSQFNLELSSEDGGLPWLDHFSLSGDGFGDAAPSQQAHLFFGKRGVYELRGRFWRQEHFFSLPSFALNGHGEDSARRVTDLTLRFFPHQKLTVELGYVRNYHYGTHFSSATYFQDIFMLSDPRRSLTQDFRVGANLDLGPVQASLFQNFRKYKDDPEQTENGNLGPGRPAEIDASLPVRLSVPSTSFDIRVAPSWRWELEGRYRYSDGHAEAGRSEFVALKLTEGITLEEIIRGNSVSDRPEHDASIDFTVSITENLLFHNTLAIHRFDLDGEIFQESTLQGTEPGSGSLVIVDENTSFLEYRHFRNRPELELQLGPRLSLFGGYQYGDREVNEGQAESKTTTVTHSGFAGVAFKPYSGSRLSVEFEQGTGDQAITRTETQDFTRLRFSSHFPVRGGVSIQPHFSLLNRDNTSFEDEFDSDHWQGGVEVLYQDPDQRFSLSAGYSLFDLESEAAIRFFAARQRVSSQSQYQSQLHFLHSRATIAVGSRLDLNLGYRYLQDSDEASFPLKRHQGHAGLLLKTGERLAWELAWDHTSYNEKLQSTQDYMANRLAVSLIWGF